MYSTEKLFDDKLLSKFYLNRPRYCDKVASIIIDFWESYNNRKGENLNILDIGCGTGQLTSLFEKFANNITGVDSSASQIDVAKLNNSSKINFVVASCYELPVENQSLDLVTAAQCVHWFDLPKFYDEIDRCLKPGGVLAISVYSRQYIDPNDEIDEEIRKAVNYFIKDEFFYTDKYFGPYIDEKPKWAWAFLPQMKYLYPESGKRVENISMKWRPTVKHYSDYLRSTSMYRKWREDPKNKEQQDIVDFSENKILELLGNPATGLDTILELTLPMVIVLCAKPLDG